jgi:hypothetical protein
LTSFPLSQKKLTIKRGSSYAHLKNPKGKSFKKKQPKEAFFAENNTTI